jgi:hypothetical protein
MLADDTQACGPQQARMLAGRKRASRCRRKKACRLEAADKTAGRRHTDKQEASGKIQASSRQQTRMQANGTQAGSRQGRKQTNWRRKTASWQRHHEGGSNRRVAVLVFRPDRGQAGLGTAQVDSKRAGRV